MINSRKFTERQKKAPRESEPEEAEKKDLRGPRCFECSGFGHIRADCGNLKQAKGPTMRLSVMSQKKRKKLLLKIKNL
jgi:hypothetical protein